MYIGNTAGLAEKLRRNDLPQSEQIKYYLAFLIICTLGGLASVYPFKDSPRPEIIILFANIIGAIAITLFCYNWNNKGDGKNFIVRDICLFLPISVNLIIGSVWLLFIILLFETGFATFQAKTLTFRHSVETPSVT